MTTPHHKARSGNRLEAFSDGVIAVIITIMVLELHVPHEEGLHGLLAVAPRIGLYLLSFLTVGIYWVNHHEICRRIESIDYRVLWANLGWLFTLSLVPFFTDYVGDKHFDSFSTALYAVTMMAVGVGYGILRLAINARQKQLGEYSREDRSELVKHALSILLYAASIVMAWRNVWISFGLNLAVTLVWIAPELGTNNHCEEA